MSSPTDTDLAGARAALDEHRAALGDIDREILKLVAERQRLAGLIGQQKRTLGLPTRDYRQERDVIERARTQAAAVGLPATLGESLALALISASLTAQERDQVQARGDGSGRRVLVIGGLGLMGQWMCKFLAAQGYLVEIADPSATQTITAQGWPCVSDYRTMPLTHDFIVLAAPMAACGAIYSELATHPPAGIVFDLASLKSPLRIGLGALRAAGGHVTSVHPMFGPDTELLSGRHVIFVDCGDAGATAQARAMFESTMATLVAMDLESHDRMMAYVLGLSHALNIAFFTALADSGEAADGLAKLSSTTFEAQLSVAAKVARENPDLYFAIQTQNDYGTESLAALLFAVEKVRSVVRAGDAAAFRELMARGQAYFAARQQATR